MSATIALTSITFAIAMVPIVVNVTIFNTAPFWTTFLAWLMLGDKITCFEVIAMAASFGCIIVIGMSSNIKGEETDEPKEEVVVEEKDDDKLLSGRQELFVGCCLMLLTAWGFSAVNVITRKM